MDAGANVHMLFRQDQKKSFADYREHFAAKYKVLAFEGVKHDVH
jgi:diphosphomevalonate decarboxylase